MANLVKGGDLGTKLCEALGVDPGNVVSITIHCAAGDVAHVKIETLVKTDVVPAVEKVMEAYHLVKDEPQKEGDAG